MLTIIGLLIASFMLYFPYYWCRIKQENEIDFGLKWFLDKNSKRDVIFALLFTLVPLTFVSMNWPAELGGAGPHKVSFMNALDYLGGGIAAAFIEETFYRGWLQTLLTRKTGAFIAIFITSLIFSLSHLIILAGKESVFLVYFLRLATFFPGLIMGWLRWRGRSVLPSIIYHAVCNVWAVWWAPIP